VSVVSRTGLCQVCEAAAAQFGCDACGAAVCSDHYERTTGLCIQCAQTGDDDPPEFRV
jgi:hypothetical protein